MGSIFKNQKDLIFRGQWLGGGQIDLPETNAKIFRVMIQVPEFAYNEMKRLSNNTTNLGFIVSKYEPKQGEQYHVNAKPRERQKKQIDGTGKRSKARTATS